MINQGIIYSGLKKGKFLLQLLHVAESEPSGPETWMAGGVYGITVLTSDGIGEPVEGYSRSKCHRIKRRLCEYWQRLELRRYRKLK